MSRRAIISSFCPSSSSQASQTTGAIITDAIRRRPNMIYAADAVVVVVTLWLTADLWCPSPAGAPRCQVNAEATTGGHHKPHDSSAHPPVYVDTKYWIRSTEFGERDNWLNQLRPCTLFERIKMNEQSVVSMGSSMDALGGSLLNANNIYELALAQNGVLLLEEDLPADPIESAFIDFLKLVGDCTDGDSVHLGADNTAAEPPNGSGGDGKRHLFEFEPDSDEMSWFNPENWASTPNEFNIEEWIPESHQIPCSEDIVVFGDRQNLLAPILETGERDKTASFKVNFRPSKAISAANNSNNSDGKTKAPSNSIDSLRVSRLIIGERHYDQREFDNLVNSDDYRDILFQFNDSESALRLDLGGYSAVGSPLIIDESSLVRDSSENMCLDEAGCLCGNEQPEVMQVVCSFHEPLTDDDLPCHDPIYSAGYCNKICATSLTISMDPGKFSERFLSSNINKLIKDNKEVAGSVLVGPRRIDVDKYEIVFRYVPDDDENFSSTGIERDSAQLILQELERGAIKSFYGIRAIKTKSSVKWRRNNRSLIFWLTAASILSISVAVLARRDADKSFNSEVNYEANTPNWLTDIWDQVRQSGHSVEASSESFMRFANQPTSPERGSSDMNGSLSNIPLMELEEDDTREDH